MKIPASQANALPQAHRDRAAERQRAHGVDDVGHRLVVGERLEPAGHRRDRHERRGQEREGEQPDQPERLQAQGRTGPPSALAIKSVRALATTMITIIQARDGASRWCETAYSTPDVAQTFLQIFPATQFICLYRSMREVLSEAVRTYPWGLGSTPLWAYATGHPGNNAATIAAYWTARTQALLEFESGHPDCSLRVRYEDLAADPVRHAADIFATLGLDDSQLTVLPEPSAMEPSAVHDAAAGAGEPTVPTDLIPPALMARAGELHARLGFEF
jgi:Sulfotransferase family